MKISIITVVYNRRDTIAEALRSLRAQTYREIEHIVIDGGSRDGTLDVLRAEADEATILVSEPDDGIYDALNKGLERATGEIVGVLHSDDVLAHERVLATVAEAFGDGPDAVYGDLDYVRRDDISRILRRWRSGAFTPGRLRAGWMPPIPLSFCDAASSSASAATTPRSGSPETTMRSCDTFRPTGSGRPTSRRSWSGCGSGGRAIALSGVSCGSRGRITGRSAATRSAASPLWCSRTPERPASSSEHAPDTRARDCASRGQDRHQSATQA